MSELSDLNQPDFFTEIWTAIKNYIPQKDRYTAARKLVDVYDSIGNDEELKDYTRWYVLMPRLHILLRRKSMSELPDFFTEMWTAIKNYIPQKDRHDAARRIVDVYDGIGDVEELRDYTGQDDYLDNALSNYFNEVEEFEDSDAETDDEY